MGTFQTFQSRAILRDLLIVAAVGFAIWVAHRLGRIVIVLVLAMFLAYLIAPLVDLVQHPVALRGRSRHLPRGPAIAVVYLMLAGGLMLLWIAYRLLTQQENDGQDLAPAASFWAAMQTIVVADAVMGLDNVLAVAGAAGGSSLLVVCGLLISIPIVIWGSTLILKWIERFPSIVYVGGAVLAWTAAKMVAGEPFVQEWLSFTRNTWPIYAGAVLGTLGLAWIANRRRPSTAQHS